MIGRLWLWFTRHSRAAAWLSGGLAVVLIAGGTALGISRTPAPAIDLSEGPLQAQPVSARVAASRHSVVGTVRAVGPSEILVRSARGAYFTIRWVPVTQFRMSGRAIRPAALHAGDRVVVIGQPASDGSLVATYLTVVAAASAPAPPATAPAQGPAGPE